MAYQFTNISDMQRKIAPSVYQCVDLEITPERFRSKLSETSLIKGNKRIQALLADPEKVEFFRQLTLMGDPIADAYAALFPKLGFAQARKMLVQALDQGIESVENAPPELVTFIAAMHEEPKWLDWEKIESASESMRLFTAVFSQFFIRAAFMMTYVNGYQGLPMVITGALSSKSAGKRMKETTSTLRMAMLPGALRPGGVAFKSAAKVRIMHAMVRIHLLNKPESWDFEVYGTPIPQVDQMGAALMGSYFLALITLKRGKKRFGKRSSAAIDQFRYLAYLLGMHDQFLSDDPKQIVETWNMVQATLPHKYDERGRQLNEATINAYVRKDRSLLNRSIHALDTKASKLAYQLIVGKRTAKMMGAKPNIADKLAYAALIAPISLRFASLSLVKWLPGGRKKIDDYAIKLLRQQLSLDGEAEFKTDSTQYNDIKAKQAV